jgi:ABC-type glucose/galactose transport system permease subunit
LVMRSDAADMDVTSDRPLREFSNALALLVIGGVFAVLDSKFLGARNLSLLMTELSITAILALGMLVIILPGHIDLSVGSGVGLLGGVAAVLVIQQGWPAPLAMGVAVLVGLGLWLAMGTLIVREKMPAFIVTLGGLLLFKGLFWLVIQNSTIPVVQGGAVNLYALLTTYYSDVGPVAGKKKSAGEWAGGGVRGDVLFAAVCDGAGLGSVRAGDESVSRHSTAGAAAGWGGAGGSGGDAAHGLWPISVCGGGQ